MDALTTVRIGGRMLLATLAQQADALLRPQENSQKLPSTALPPRVGPILVGNGFFCCSDCFCNDLRNEDHRAVFYCTLVSPSRKIGNFNRTPSWCPRTTEI